MCTVSFIYSNNVAILTHNRDEKTSRPSAIHPKPYLINNKTIYFPKDPQAGGTWFALTQSKTVLVLLNGAQEKHSPKPFYRKSRGLIVLDLISADSPIDEWNKIELSNIEPFTIVLFHESKLYQLRWNDVEKIILNLEVSQSYIWSSSTLYSEEVRKNREILFQDFLNSNILSPKEILHFHQYTNENDLENGLIINRNGKLITQSITQTVFDENKVVLSYVDLINHQEFTNLITQIII